MKVGYTDSDSTYSMNRLLYSKKTYDPIIAKKKIGASSASETTTRNRMVSIGKVDNSLGYMSMSNTNSNVADNALRRVRSSGSTVPKKVTTKNVHIIKPPNPPYYITGTTGNQQITLSFTPGETFGYPIINYLYSYDGVTYVEFSPPVTSNSVTLTGLTNGTPYTIFLKAKSEISVGKYTSLPVTFTPSTLPDAPTSLVATAGDKLITISFTQGFNGGAPITNYMYSATPTDVSVMEPFVALNPIDASSPITITGLTNQKTYTVYLKAVNKNGASVSSVSVSAKPISPYDSTLPALPSGSKPLFQLDAKDPASYPGSGTTWVDVAPNPVLFNGTDNYETHNATFNSTTTGYSNIDSAIYYFDMSNNSNITIPDSTILQAKVGGPNRTFVVWAYITTEQPGKGLFSKMYSSTNSKYGYSLVFDSNRNLNLNMKGITDTNFSTSNSMYSLVQNNVYELNKWQMFTGVVCFGGSSINLCKIYVNNIPVMSGGSLETSLNSAAPIVIPCGQQDGLTYSNCRIGGVYYYDKALTNDDITLLYTKTKERFGIV